LEAEIQLLQEQLAAIRREVAKVILGQEQAIGFALIAILTGQHALIEGVPGLAKTLLVRTLARIMSVDFRRIQFTPDLMPSDITGTSVFNMRDSTFEFRKGPIFTSFLLADEINRAPAKTQAALLEAMQERTVTADGVTHELSHSFTVFATQNPIEFEGTYPLPEAQKDRFLLKINMEWPRREEEFELARRMIAGTAPETTLETGQVSAVVALEDVAAIRVLLQKVYIRDEIMSYVVDLVRMTRSTDSILAGAGPRATQALVLSSRARAAIEGRDFVTPDDVKALALPVLEHRLILRPEFEMEGVTAAEAISKLLTEVPVPR
jgi:MoxR-like ATPase